MCFIFYFLSIHVLKNSKIEVDVFISTEENITAYQDITNLNINELNKE